MGGSGAGSSTLWHDLAYDDVVQVRRFSGQPRRRVPERYEGDDVHGGRRPEEAGAEKRRRRRGRGHHVRERTASRVDAPAMQGASSEPSREPAGVVARMLRSARRRKDAFNTTKALLLWTCLGAGLAAIHCARARANGGALPPAARRRRMLRLPRSRPESKPVPPRRRAIASKPPSASSWKVDEAGDVIAARVMTPQDNGFDEAALAAAKQFKFEPAKQGDTPVRSTIQLSYEFHLPPLRRRPCAAATAAAPPARAADSVPQSGRSNDDRPPRAVPSARRPRSPCRIGSFQLRPIGSVQDICASPRVS